MGFSPFEFEIWNKGGQLITIATFVIEFIGILRLLKRKDEKIYIFNSPDAIIYLPNSDK